MRQTSWLPWFPMWMGEPAASASGDVEQRVSIFWNGLAPSRRRAVIPLRHRERASPLLLPSPVRIRRCHSIPQNPLSFFSLDSHLQLSAKRFDGLSSRGLCRILRNMIGKCRGTFATPPHLLSSYRPSLHCTRSDWRIHHDQRSLIAAISLSALITTIHSPTRIFSSNHGYLKTSLVPRLGFRLHSLLNLRQFSGFGMYGNSIKRCETASHLSICNCSHFGGNVFLRCSWKLPLNTSMP